MSDTEKVLYARLKAAGHSPMKAAEIVIDVRRGHCHALRWIAAIAS